MAARKSGFIIGTAEYIVSRPIHATITVGTAIILMQILVRYGSEFWPESIVLLYLIPFIPPFFVTRTAKRINQRRAEYDFINDAEPYIFVGFPDKLSVESMLNTMPDMVSDSAIEHLNIPAHELMDLQILPPNIMTNQNDRREIVEKLIADFREHGSKGVLRNFHTSLKPMGQSKNVSYLMNSVLKKAGNRLKWQGTLVKQVQSN